ncbi:phage tail tape measure protein [Microbacterium sp. CFH 90308]|uniref:Phage tail tape measure protein n=1 Tax=Microbacterium salsuginis TaxID=2722803 RepID=A0ABX1KEH1_9MICO|nr:phage tail tape measure protein [Microbacterium sp. CFH 90308]NLP85441.1 phage tail tape measure protein [Microbacterium sp. CFH 90308]
MADRQVKTTLSVQMQQYVDGMKKAAKATRETSDEAKKLAEQREAFNQLGRVGLTTGAVLAAGFAVAVTKMAEFDAAMSNVAATGQDATDNIDALREAALEAGSSTVFSATQSANAIEELAKAGVSAADILNGGLAGALDLAAAGEIQVADAAGIAATALKTFNLEGDDMSHVADLMAAGAGKAMGGVDDLSQALDQVALVASGAGLSIEETTAGLAAFASQGLLGSDAGTSFRTMLGSLTPNSAAAADEMERLGISAFDSQGQFIGLAEFAGNLQTSLQGLTDEQRQATIEMIFGQDAQRAANALYKEGEAGIRAWITAVDDQGYAARTAATRLDNLKGDFEALQGAIDTAFIQTGAAANDSIRTLVQTLTGLVDSYNDLPEPVKGATLAVGGATAAIGLASGTALLAVPKFLELRDVLQKSGIGMGALSLKAGAAGAALGGLFAIVGELARRHQEARAKAESYAGAIEQGTEAVQNMTLENLQAEESWLWVTRGSAADAAEKFGFTLRDLADAAEGDKDALKAMNDVIAAGQGDQDAANRLMDEYGLSLLEVSSASGLVAEAIGNESRALAEGARILDQKKEATEEEAGSTRDAAQAYMDAASEVSDLNSELSQLIETINEANGVGQDAITANLNYRDALAEVDALIAEGATGWDANTQAGRDNQSMLVDIAKQAQDAAEAEFKLDGNTESYRATLEGSRQALIDRAMQLGANADEAGALADQIFRIPSATEWELIAHTAAAQDAINRFIWANDGRRVNLIVDGVPGRQVHGTDVLARAFGGRINGPGTTTSDSIPVMASDEEHMLSAAEVRGMGGHAAVEAMRAAARAGQFDPGQFDSGQHWVASAPMYATPHGGAAASVSFPETITLVDADGSILAHARVIAGEAIASNNAHLNQQDNAGRRRQY